MPQLAYYEYETSPRKIEPKYKKKPQSTQAKKKKTVSKAAKSKAYQKKLKEAQKRKLKSQFMAVTYVCAIAFCAFVFISTKAKVSESFARIQGLKSDVLALEKENDQLEIEIQNSMNINNIEQQARDLLGMQKLTNKQIVNINFPKTDYVQPVNEKVVIEENSIISKIKNLISDIF